MSSKSMIDRYKDVVEQRLVEIIEKNQAPKVLKDAMAYSLQAGGKRIRPCLMLEFYRLLDKEPSEILNFACALEMIHTYSLIHDDLPCMDNDDFRRGKLSNHVVFGEATALLAGDALLTLAFETAADINDNVNSAYAVKAIGFLGSAAGMCNMVGGQILDLDAEGKEISIDELKEIQKGKTVALINVAAQIACVLAGADEVKTALAEKYCECIGKAFQIRDDILDVIGDQKTLGKPIGSDSQEKKNTYVSILGIEQSQDLVDKLTKSANRSIVQFSDKSSDLQELADMLSNRNN